MKTEKLFVNDVYMKEADMTLLEIKKDGKGVKAAFDRTVFYPTGGGQLCDTGTIAGLRVFDVNEDKETGLIWHSFEDEKALELLEKGQPYRGVLDWEKRFSHMQLHAGEHILSGLFHSLFGAENKGFHMNEDYVTIDIGHPDGYLDEEAYRKAEKAANEAIFQNLEIKTYFFDTAKDAMVLPVRKEIKFGENISIVLIGDEKDPVDCCACCGTHPKHTGEIGLIKITHCEKYKGMNRFYVKCGIKAFEHYSYLEDIADSLGRKYSCEIGNLEKTLEKEQKRNEDNYRKYNTLKSYSLNEEAKKLREDFEKETKESIRVYRYRQYTSDDLQSLARLLEKDITKPCLFICENEATCILASSGNPDCGKIVKDNAGIYHGKGGGKNNLARAIFEDMESVELFADMTEKHLR